MKIIPRKGIRLGQELFNFFEWLRLKGYPANQSFRMADTFHISDEDFEKLYAEWRKENEGEKEL